jgi:hypothetical protein
MSGPVFLFQIFIITPLPLPRDITFIYSFVWFWNIVDHWFKQEKKGKKRGGGEFYLWLLQLNKCYVSTV